MAWKKRTLTRPGKLERPPLFRSLFGKKLPGRAAKRQARLISRTCCPLPPKTQFLRRLAIAAHRRRRAGVPGVSCRNFLLKCSYNAPPVDPLRFAQRRRMFFANGQARRKTCRLLHARRKGGQRVARSPSPPCTADVSPKDRRVMPAQTAKISVVAIHCAGKSRARTGALVNLLITRRPGRPSAFNAGMQAEKLTAAK